MDWLTWRLTGWVGPQLPPFGGFLGWKIDFQTDVDTFTTELWVIWGQKITLLDASISLDLILLQAGIKQRGCSCGLKTVSRFSEQWMWHENKVTWLSLLRNLTGAWLKGWIKFPWKLQTSLWKACSVWRIKKLSLWSDSHRKNTTGWIEL